MLDLLLWMLTGVPLQGSDTQLREAWITSELLVSDKSILPFFQPYNCRLYGWEPGKDLLVNTCLLDHFLSCIGEEDINSMSGLDGLNQSSGSHCSRGSYNDSRNNTNDESSQEVPHPHLQWGRLRAARLPGSSHSWVTLTGSQTSVCLWTTKTIVRLSWVKLVWVRQLA